MLQLKDIRGDHKIKGYFPGHLTAGTAKEVSIGRAPFKCRVTAVSFIPSADITGAATNNFTLNVRNRTTGAGTVIPAALVFDNGINATAQTPKTITLSATAADLVLAEGDVITVQKAVNSSGLACPDGVVEVTVQAIGV